MSFSSILLLLIVAWFVIGLALSFTLGRRGHDPGGWFVLGTLAGPLAIFWAIDASRNEERPKPEVIAAPVQGDGRVDVLVGFDGSPQSDAAVHSLIDLLGDRVGRLTLVTVLPYDGATSDEDAARRELELEGSRLGWMGAGLEIVHGHPAHALMGAAVDGGYDLVAVGKTGQGHAHLLGSAARELAASHEVPVLVG